MTYKCPQIALVGALALASIPTLAIAASAPVKVTRFHLGQPIPAGTMTIDFAPGSAITPGPEEQLYADAIADAMAPAGFTRATPDATSDYHVVVTINRDVTALPKAPSPFQIGLGGGGGDGGFGVGGGVSFGVGKRQERSLVTTTLAVRILRGPAAEAIWEGRATQAVEERGKPIQPGATVQKMAAALFKGFPGTSGRTISVK